ncbi:hypothetical protein pb186bvf_015148 [Paramecium bursaria]
MRQFRERSRSNLEYDDTYQKLALLDQFNAQLRGNANEYQQHFQTQIPQIRQQPIFPQIEKRFQTTQHAENQITQNQIPIQEKRYPTPPPKLNNSRLQSQIQNTNPPIPHEYSIQRPMPTVVTQILRKTPQTLNNSSSIPEQKLRDVSSALAVQNQKIKQLLKQQREFKMVDDIKQEMNLIKSQIQQISTQIPQYKQEELEQMSEIRQQLSQIRKRPQYPPFYQQYPQYPMYPQYPQYQIPYYPQFNYDQMQQNQKPQQAPIPNPNINVIQPPESGKRKSKRPKKSRALSHQRQPTPLNPMNSQQQLIVPQNNVGSNGQITPTPQSYQQSIHSDDSDETYVYQPSRLKVAFQAVRALTRWKIACKPINLQWKKLYNNLVECKREIAQITQTVVLSRITNWCLVVLAKVGNFIENIKEIDFINPKVPLSEQQIDQAFIQLTTAMKYVMSSLLTYSTVDFVIPELKLLSYVQYFDQQEIDRGLFVAKRVLFWKIGQLEMSKIQQQMITCELILLVHIIPTLINMKGSKFLIKCISSLLQAHFMKYFDLRILNKFPQYHLVYIQVETTPEKLVQNLNEVKDMNDERYILGLYEESDFSNFYLKRPKFQDEMHKNLTQISENLLQSMQQ